MKKLLLLSSVALVALVLLFAVAYDRPKRPDKNNATETECASTEENAPTNGCFGFITVVGWHNVAPKDKPVRGDDIKEENFEAFLKYLRDNQIEVVPIDAVANSRTPGKAAGKKVAITFDDGKCGSGTAAAELLAKYNMPATWFLVPHWIEDATRRIGDRSCLDNYNNYDIMTWKDVAKLSQNPLFSLQAHGYSHAENPRPKNSKLRGLTKYETEEAMREELTKAVEVIHERIENAAVTSMAWPYNDYDAKVAEVASECFDYVIGGNKMIRKVAPNFQIPRVGWGGSMNKDMNQYYKAVDAWIRGNGELTWQDHP